MKNLATTIFSLALVSCGGVGAPDSVATFDLEGAIDNPKIFDLGALARGVEYTPLDDVSPVGEIAVWNGIQPAIGGGWYIAPTDSQGTPPQHFDAGGKFLGHVGRMGRGPGETAFIVGVMPNHDTGEIYIDGTSEIVGLDARGNEFARAGDMLHWAAMWYGDRLLTLTIPMLWDSEVYARDTIPFIKTFDRDLKPAGDIFGPNVGPFMSMTVRGGTAPPFFSYNGHRLLVMQGRSDTLYQYGAGAVRPACVVRLGAYTSPAEVFGMEHSMDWSDRMFVVTNAWEGSRWMIFQVTNGPATGETPILRYLFLDRNDAAEGFTTLGPEREQGLFLGGVRFTPAYVRGDRLVGYMQALDIVDERERITDPELARIAAGMTETSNPVLVTVELN